MSQPENRSFSFIYLLPFLISGLVSISSAQSAGGTEDSPHVKIATNKGDITIELEQKLAPVSVKNFLAYIDADFYTGTIFHRVIDNFMIQGGGFTENYQRKETQPTIRNEANNGLKNKKYTLAMARTNAPHSATAQFFINTTDNDYLDHTEATAKGWGYAVFGRVVEGQDIVDAIGQVQTGAGGPFSRDAPVEPIIIESMSRVTAEGTVAAETDTAKSE